jgi:hypothetical protein
MKILYGIITATMTSALIKCLPWVLDHVFNSDNELRRSNVFISSLEFLPNDLKPFIPSGAVTSL